MLIVRRSIAKDNRPYLPGPGSVGAVYNVQPMRTAPAS